MSPNAAAEIRIAATPRRITITTSGDHCDLWDLVPVIGYLRRLEVLPRGVLSGGDGDRDVIALG
ncbi:hypothetical protein [Streptosporangium sp. NPDC049644]|uniref:hypothetical protein n=1 Tax=Streptosporangium sp. NPDC049644 TaxID=3155507 RepID=UPI003420FAFF